MQKWPLTGAAVVALVLVTRSTLFSADRHHGAAAHPTDATALAPGACTVSSARTQRRGLGPRNGGGEPRAEAPHFVPFAGGGQGNLCVGSPVRRGDGSVIFGTGLTGSSAVRVNLQALPQPMGPIAVLPGNTFHFQAWHRDTFGGGTTSNLTDAVRILFIYASRARRSAPRSASRSRRAASAPQSSGRSSSSLPSDRESL